MEILTSFSYAFVFLQVVSFAFAQVCSPFGVLCTRTTDCCKGCCEGHVCVDRSFSCSSDMTSQLGYDSCQHYFCPPDHFCFLKEICPPENECARQPQCRRNPSMSYNYTDFFDNSAPIYRNQWLASLSIMLFAFYFPGL